MEIDVPRPEYTPLTPVESGMVLYRGLTPFEGVEFKRGRLVVRPRAPLRANAHDWLTFDGFADSDVLRLLHVLEHRRQHAVSFTATKPVGDHYAASLDVKRQFVRKGLVGEVKLADLVLSRGWKPIATRAPRLPSPRSSLVVTPP